MVMSTVMEHEKELNEQQLIERILSGDRAAFKILVDRLGPKVINFCYKITGNRMDAEDIAQEVFIETYKNLKKFRGDASLTTWILRIAHNRSLNYLRDKRPKGIISLDSKNDSDAVNFGDSLPGKESDRPDRNFEAERNRSILYNAIAELPEKLQKPFTLHKLEGMSYEEIAQLLKISLSAVESRIHRAKLRLQKELARKLNR